MRAACFRLFVGLFAELEWTMAQPSPNADLAGERAGEAEMDKWWPYWPG
jgi:hypothetical protein